MIGGTLPPVIAVLDANTAEFTRKMGAAAGEMGAGGKLQGAMKGLATIGVATGVAVAAIGAYAVHAATEFDASMERVHTQAGASQAEVERLKSSVLSLAGPVAQSPNELALGLYHIESAGFRGATALAMLTAAAQGATIGNANLEDVSQAMIATMASGIKGVGSASDAMALLNTTVGIGDMKMEQLAKAMATGVLPSARVAGLSFEDVAAALATVTDNATPADETATRLRMTFAMMGSPTQAAAKHLKAMGISATELAGDMRKPNGLLMALQDLKDHMDKMSGGFKGIAASQALVRAFGGGRSSGTIMTLLTQLDRLKTKYAELGTATQRQKQYQDAWQKTQDTFNYKVNALKATLEQLAVRLGNMLIPVIEKVVGWLLVGVQWLEKHQAAAQALGAAVGGVLVVALLAAVAAFAEFVGPIALVVAGIAAVSGAVVSFVTHSKAMRDMWTKDIMPVLKIVAEWVKDRLVNAWNAFSTMISTKVIPALKEAWKSFVQQVQPALEKLRGEFEKHKPLLQQIGHFVDVLVSSYMQLEGWLASKIIPAFGWFAGHAFGVIVNVFSWFADVVQNVATAFGNVESAIGKVTGPLTSITGMISNIGGKVSGGLGGLLGKIGLASGGSMDGPRVVGENGPELFIPRGSGTVLPNWQTRQVTAGAGGGGGGGRAEVAEVHATFQIDSRTVFTAVQTEALQHKRRSGNNGLG